jgi:hypothetical protein
LDCFFLLSFFFPAETCFFQQRKRTYGAIKQSKKVVHVGGGCRRDNNMDATMAGPPLKIANYMKIAKQFSRFGVKFLH